MQCVTHPNKACNIYVLGTNSWFNTDCLPVNFSGPRAKRTPEHFTALCKGPLHKLSKHHLIFSPRPVLRQRHHTDNSRHHLGRWLKCGGRHIK
jgi:hypothetical protein